MIYAKHSFVDLAQSPLVELTMSATDTSRNEYLVGAAVRVTDAAEANQDLSGSLKVWVIL